MMKERTQATKARKKNEKTNTTKEMNKKIHCPPIFLSFPLALIADAADVAVAAAVDETVAVDHRRCLACIEEPSRCGC